MPGGNAWGAGPKIFKPVQSKCFLGHQEQFKTILTLISVSQSEQNSQRYSKFFDYSPFCDLWFLLWFSFVSTVFSDTVGGLAPRKFGNLYSVADKILADLPIFQVLHFNIAGSVLRGKTVHLKKSP